MEKPMRHFFLLLAILLVASASRAQSVSHLTVTDNGNAVVLAGNFNNDGGGDIVSVDSAGNVNCLPSDGGKYDLATVVSPVQFPSSVTSGSTTATLKIGASDYIMLGGDGIVNVYSSSSCTFTFTQSLVVEGFVSNVVVTPPPSGNGGVYVTVVSGVGGETGPIFFSAVFQNSDGTLAPGPAGLGLGNEGFAAGSSIAISNFVEPQPPGPVTTVSISFWKFADGAWTNTPSFIPPGFPEGFVTAPNTGALYLISIDTSNIYVQQVDPSSGAASAPVAFPVGAEANSPVTFGADSFAMAINFGVQIFQDSTGNGIWAPLGDPITVAIPGSQNLRTWSTGAALPSGFALQSPDGTATAFTVTNGAMVSAPTSLVFPPTEPGSSSSLPLTLTNTGNLPLNVTGGSFSGTNSADFSQTNNCTAVAPGTACTVMILFAPSSLSAESAQLALESNAVNSPTDVALTSAPAPVAILTTSSTSLDFGTVAVNSSATKMLTIGNSGNATLTSLAVQVSGSGFTLANPCPASLAALAQCSVTVTFTPTAGGNVTGTLTITSSLSPVTVALLGSGSAPAVTAAPPALTASGGGMVTAQITFSNFPSMPTLTASCQIPAGSCSIQNNSELVVTTTPRSTAIAPTNTGRKWLWPAAILALLMMWIIAPRRRRVTVTFAALTMLTACGGSGSPPKNTGTPAGTYNVIVTGTAGAVMQSVTVPVTVN
jgi:hypothetical protein